MSDPIIEDRIDCMHRSIAKLRPDIRQIVHEEIKNIVEEALSNLLNELQNPDPKPYIERGYRA